MKETRHRKNSWKDGVMRPFLLGSVAVSDAVCWSAFFIRVSRMEPGIQAGVLEVLLLLASFLLGICFAVLWQGIFRQFDALEDATEHWDTMRPEERDAVFASLYGPAGQAGNAFRRRINRLEQMLKSVQEQTRADTERAVKLQIARDICSSALPGRLPDYPNRENFAVAGIVRDGWRNAYVFYDIFFIDPGLLCVSVGQVPYGEVAEALYMAVFMKMAQTTIRLRLRMGRSLAEALADVNTQIYDMGQNRSAAVFVGTLDTFSGKFSYVNAGSCPPLIMRNDQDYEWLDTPLSAALGQAQNVTYRVHKLRLRQGDRIFLHTAGLGMEQNADGTAFREQELRSALIRTQGQEITLEESLRIVSDRAEQYADAEKRLGYAALMLEFRRGDRELSHCRVPAAAESASEVMQFLKTRFEENGIRRQHYARVAVLAEELFFLCCREAASDSVLTVECGVAPDGGSVNIRISGSFHGRNPLRIVPENTPDGQSAVFIKEQAEYTDFRVGKEQNRDTVVMVCFLTQ